MSCLWAGQRQLILQLRKRPPLGQIQLVQKLVIQLRAHSLLLENRKRLTA
jgi:hypothetical protein